MCINCGVIMGEVKAILMAYYERLYEKLENSRDILTQKVKRILSEEIAIGGYGDFNGEKYAAYEQACLAFVDERIEAYNPTGVQYTFDNIRCKMVDELELKLNWYDSEAEFAYLLAAVHKKAELAVDDTRIRELADEIILEQGAFPDMSIIARYEREPGLSKLPDYVASRAIEELLR